MTGADIVAEARTYIGTPWRHQGRSREGIDCAGLVLKVMHAMEITDFDAADYSRQATDESMVQACREHLVDVSLAEARPGDVAVMRFGSNRHIGFFGDYLYGGLSLIHAFSRRIDGRKRPQVVEHRFTDDFLRSHGAALIATFRLPRVSA
jgi:cell wall-associated NlpC family hydrolase